MKKISFLLAMILSFSVLVSFAATAGSTLRLIKASGSVNTSEIGGRGLYVFSLWGERATSGVKEDGSFATEISSSRPQKLSVKDDQGMTRALAIVLPKNAEQIVFDARSTAAALLFQDQNSFRSSQAAQDLLTTMAQHQSFQELVSFLKKKLIVHSLEALVDDSECIALLETCNDVIFQENTPAVRKALYEAKDRLEQDL